MDMVTVVMLLICPWLQRKDGVGTKVCESLFSQGGNRCCTRATSVSETMFLDKNEKQVCEA